jgi:hypothetical protein
MEAGIDANQDDYRVSKQDQTARANTITDEDIKRWIELFKDAGWRLGWRSGQTRCMRCGHVEDGIHRQLWRACDGVCICCNNERDGGHEGKVCPIMRENPEFFNGEFWKQRTETQIGQAPKDLDYEQLTRHRARIHDNTALLALVAVRGAYSYPPFPYIPAPFFRSANPYFPPPPGYYSGYSPAVGYYCLAYPTGNAPQIPAYRATVSINPKQDMVTSATTDEPTNHDGSAKPRQYKKPGKNTRSKLGLRRDGIPKGHGKGEDGGVTATDGGE